MIIQLYIFIAINTWHQICHLNNAFSVYILINLFDSF